MKKEVRELLNKYNSANESKLRCFLEIIREEAALEHDIMIPDVIGREEFAQACHYNDNEHIKKRVEDEEDTLWPKLVIDFYESHIGEGSCGTEEGSRPVFVRNFLENHSEADDDEYVLDKTSMVFSKNEEED
jgi:hypothetical protein